MAQTNKISTIGNVTLDHSVSLRRLIRLGDEDVHMVQLGRIRGPILEEIQASLRGTD